MLVQLIDFPNKDQIASNNKKQNELFFSLHVYVFLIDFLKDRDIVNVLPTNQARTIDIS